MLYIEKYINKDFITFEDLKTTFLPKNGETYINTDMSLNIDKIVIYHHCGIGIYLKNNLLNFIKCNNISIYYEEDYECLKIIYNNSAEHKKIENKNVDFLNKSIIVRYSNNIYQEKNNYNEVYLGEIVIPKKIINPIISNKSKNCNLSMFDILVKNIIFILMEKDNDIKKIKEMINKIFSIYSYKVVEKTNIKINNDFLYIIDFINNDKSFKFIHNTLFVKTLYSKREDFITLNEFYDFVYEMKSNL